MAYDKVIDSTALDAGMVATANAIREKTGQAGAIPWENDKGFSAAVAGIQVGGGSGGLSEQELLEKNAVNEWPSGVIHLNCAEVKGNFSLKPITELYAPNLKTVGGSSFSGCTKLTKVYLPMLEGASGQLSFQGCTALETVELPSIQLLYITFSDCSKLSTVILGPNLTMIRERTFLNCYPLKTVVIRAEKVPTLNHMNAFQGTPLYGGGTGGTIYVPAALIEQYQQATNWSTLYAAGTCNFVAIEGSEYE